MAKGEKRTDLVFPGRGQVYTGDVLDCLRRCGDNSVDLVFGSPPYEKARAYGGSGTRVSSEDWARWMVEVFKEATRVSRGLVAMVVEGQTRGYDYSCAPYLLLADLRRAVRCRDCGKIVNGGKLHECEAGSLAASAILNGRRFVTSDIRENQVDLIGRRVAEAIKRMSPSVRQFWEGLQNG